MSTPYVGEIRMFAGNFAPAGWMFCQGQLVSVDENDVLFNLIGTTYGGDGITNFALPNLSSRIPVHSSSSYPLGATGGAEAVTLTTPQLPVHTHPLNASTAAATATTPSGNVWATWGDGAYSDQSPATPMSSAALAVAGGGQPHDNMPPYLAVNFIISLYGVYPQPS